MDGCKWAPYNKTKLQLKSFEEINEGGIVWWKIFGFMMWMIYTGGR